MIITDDNLRGICSSLKFAGDLQSGLLWNSMLFDDVTASVFFPQLNLAIHSVTLTGHQGTLVVCDSSRFLCIFTEYLALFCVEIIFSSFYVGLRQISAMGVQKKMYRVKWKVMMQFITCQCCGFWVDITDNLITRGLHNNITLISSIIVLKIITADKCLEKCIA